MRPQLQSEHHPTTPRPWQRWPAPQLLLPLLLAGLSESLALLRGRGSRAQAAMKWRR